MYCRSAIKERLPNYLQTSNGQLDMMNKTVLLIDDDQTTLLLVERYLRDSGFEILTATEARQGLQLLKDHPDIPVVLVDYMMPHMTGVEVLHAVQELSPPPYILLISSLPRDQIPSGLHADGFLKKPISKKNLLEVVEKGIATYESHKRNGKENHLQN